MKRMIGLGFVVMLAVASLGFQPVMAGADEAWISYHFYDYSFRFFEMPPEISITAEMVIAVSATGEKEPRFLMTIRGLDKLTAYLRLNLPNGTFQEAIPGGGLQTVATQYGYINAGKFTKNPQGEWSVSLPKAVLCSGKFSSFFPSIMFLWDEANSFWQTEAQLYPGSSYFKLGNGLRVDKVNYGMAMTVDCQ